MADKNKFVATAGVKGLAIVAIGNSVLVVPRSEAQKVKKIVELLKTQKEKTFSKYMFLKLQKIYRYHCLNSLTYFIFSYYAGNSFNY